MKKVLGSVVILVIIFSCANKNTIEFDQLNHVITKPNNDYKTILDFTKRDTILLNDLSQKLNIDICENPYQNLYLELQDCILKVPVVFKFKCPNAIKCCRNLIDFSVDKSNVVLIDSQHEVLNTEEASNIFFKSLKNNKSRSSSNLNFFVFNWDPNGLKNKQRFIEFLNGIILYKNFLKQKSTNSNVTDLNSEDQISLLNYKIVINTFNVEVPPPPPPENSIDIIKEISD